MSALWGGHDEWKEIAGSVGREMGRWRDGETEEKASRKDFGVQQKEKRRAKKEKRGERRGEERNLKRGGDE